MKTALTQLKERMTIKRDFYHKLKDMERTTAYDDVLFQIEDFIKAEKEQIMEVVELRNKELEAMLEEMINWYAKREDSPMRMNPDKVICEGNNQDEIILKAIEILNKTK